MTKPNPLCNLSGGQVLIKRNSEEIWREVSLIPRSMVVTSYLVARVVIPSLGGPDQPVRVTVKK
jgi:hypothetical protein